jgi:CheY-like chemotaxis protein
MNTSKANHTDSPLYRDKGKPLTLVIDDDVAVADTVAMVLKTDGFEAVAVYSGAVGLELAHHLAFEFLVTGVVMSRMNGIEAAIQIRDVLPKCKVLLVSGDYGAGELLQDARSRGYEFEILAKPVHPLELIQKLRSFGAAQYS